MALQRNVRFPSREAPVDCFSIDLYMMYRKHSMSSIGGQRDRHSFACSVLTRRFAWSDARSKVPSRCFSPPFRQWNAIAGFSERADRITTLKTNWAPFYKRLDCRLYPDIDCIYCAAGITAIWQDRAVLYGDDYKTGRRHPFTQSMRAEERSQASVTL